jgi:hypothetical protein
VCLHLDIKGCRRSYGGGLLNKAALPPKISAFEPFTSAKPLANAEARRALNAKNLAEP